MRKNPVKIGITAGDPAGIGPEVSLKAVNSLKERYIIPILIGRWRVGEKRLHPLTEGMREMDGTEPEPGGAYLLNVETGLPLPEPGKGSPDTGRESLAYIRKGLELWEEGALDALVTAPVSKGFIQLSGTEFTGHTGYLARETCCSDPVMLMYSEKYRVIPVTTHIPVSGIAGALSPEKICHAILEGVAALKEIDGKSPVVAVAGLDPHCGDSGAIGSFDAEVTLPAIETARNRGVDARGPFSADTLFMRENWERYGLAVSLYHDQGLIPFKVLAFDCGVNVTLGLPLVRTSPDHGTAYDLAGKGLADHRSMLEAIRLAGRLVMNRRRGE